MDRPDILTAKSGALQSETTKPDGAVPVVATWLDPADPVAAETVKTITRATLEEPDGGPPPHPG